MFCSKTEYERQLRRWNFGRRSKFQKMKILETKLAPRVRFGTFKRQQFNRLEKHFEGDTNTLPIVTGLRNVHSMQTTLDLTPPGTPGQNSQQYQHENLSPPFAFSKESLKQRPDLFMKPTISQDMTNEVSHQKSRLCALESRPLSFPRE